MLQNPFELVRAVSHVRSRTVSGPASVLGPIAGHIVRPGVSSPVRTYTAVSGVPGLSSLSW